MIYEYQKKLLRLGSRTGFDVPLDEEERARLWRSLVLLTGESAGGRRVMSRSPVPARVVFTMPGRLVVRVERDEPRMNIGFVGPRDIRQDRLDARPLSHAAHASWSA